MQFKNAELIFIKSVLFHLTKYGIISLDVSKVKWIQKDNVYFSWNILQITWFWQVGVQSFEKLVRIGPTI